MSRGTLVILSGPSGVGKDTVIDAWHLRDPRVARVVAYTTRPRRTGEVDGVAYHFVSTEDFDHFARSGYFLEFKEVHGHLYATPRHDLDVMLDEGKIAVLKIDVQGALSVIDERPGAVSVFLMPPSDEELERRIRARGLDDPEQILKRLANANSEIALADRYTFSITNDKVEDVVKELVARISKL
jgi:guanylate kinase